jgi:hypothetical protein
MEILKKYRYPAIFIILAAVIFVFIFTRGGEEDVEVPFIEEEMLFSEFTPPPAEAAEENPDPPEEIAEEYDNRRNIPLRTYFPHIDDENFAENMPVFDHLVNPFVFFAYSVGASAETLAAYGIPEHGQVKTVEDWEIRREEIRDLVMYYYYGYKWPTTYENVTVVTASRPDIDGEIYITVNETRLDGSPTTARGVVATSVWLPSFEQLERNGFWCTETNTGTGGPLVIAHFHFFTPEQIEGFLERGIGLAIAFGTPGWGETREGMYFDLFPFNAEITQYNTGTLMASAWTVSRIIDAFQLNPQWGVNPMAIASLGNSFAGKRALFAGAMDERIALTVPHESGGDGGVAPFRHSHSGRIHFYNTNGLNRVHSRHETTRTGNSGRGAANVAQFFRTSAPYEESIYLLPFDMHLVIALTAPTRFNPTRAFLSLETDNFGTWTGWSAARTVNAAAAEVFHFLGSDNIAFRQRHSGHMLQDSDYPVIWGILDHLFGNFAVHYYGAFRDLRGRRRDREIYIEDVWGVALPGIWQSIGELGRSPVETDSAWMPWSRPFTFENPWTEWRSAWSPPRKSTLWTNTQFVTAGYPAVITAYTDADYVELILWTHGDGNRLWGEENPPEQQRLGRWWRPVENGAATFELDEVDVRVGRFELRTATGGLMNASNWVDTRSVFFQGIDAHTALRHGTTRDNIGGVGGATMIGFTSRVNPETLRSYQRNENGEEIALTLSRHQAGGNWLMPYGVRLGGIPGTGPERAYILRGLQFETMQGFTFELSLQENLHTADQPAAIWNPSPEVQAIGPYPHWRPGGTGARPTADPLPPAANRPSLFNINVTADWIVNYEAGGDNSPVSHSLSIKFDAPVNPRDFGIGFNLDNFYLTWNQDNTQLQIDPPFSTMPEDEIIMYIFRLRAEGANDNTDVINTPIRHTFRRI